jgi:uncharacterized membrane protein YphA (DoxX/SURF4 family)
MSKLPLIARLLLGLLFLVFGLNGFLNFMPAPPPMPEAAGAFAGALAATGYMFPLIKGIEVLVGILLLSNKFVPLALILLAPVSVNIFLFHAVLAPAGMALPVIIVLLHVFLGWANKASFKPLFN